MYGLNKLSFLSLFPNFVNKWRKHVDIILFFKFYEQFETTIQIKK